MCPMRGAGKQLLQPCAGLGSPSKATEREKFDGERTVKHEVKSELEASSSRRRKFSTSESAPSPPRGGYACSLGARSLGFAGTTITRVAAAGDSWELTTAER
ncbi:hypothetical protein GH733_004554 [Mirounga leonina]|nr:hypothetical protein GH733_004764 [Mirounga leonina]KAF3828648.1 hypothetical protein GH733_004554 [Mirounga leonina]